MCLPALKAYPLICPAVASWGGAGVTNCGSLYIHIHYTYIIHMLYIHIYILYIYIDVLTYTHGEGEFFTLGCPIWPSGIGSWTQPRFFAKSSDMALQFPQTAQGKAAKGQGLWFVLGIHKAFEQTKKQKQSCLTWNAHLLLCPPGPPINESTRMR